MYVLFYCAWRNRFHICQTWHNIQIHAINPALPCMCTICHVCGECPPPSLCNSWGLGRCRVRWLNPKKHQQHPPNPQNIHLQPSWPMSCSWIEVILDGPLKLTVFQCLLTHWCTNQASLFIPGLLWAQRMNKTFIYNGSLSWWWLRSCQ